MALALVLVATGAHVARPAVALDLHRVGAQEAQLGLMTELDRAAETDPDAGIDADPTLAPEVFSLKGESIPSNLRLAIFVHYLVAMASESTESAQRRLGYLGLALEPAEIRELVRLYGDFDTDQRRRLEREAGDSSERWAVLMAELNLERYEFVGRIFGEWLDFLRTRGHEVESLVPSILSDLGFGGSMFFAGRIPIYEELEEQSRQFGAAFEERFGQSLRAVVPVD